MVAVYALPQSSSADVPPKASILKERRLSAPSLAHSFDSNQGIRPLACGPCARLLLKRCFDLYICTFAGLAAEMIKAGTGARSRPSLAGSLWGRDPRVSLISTKPACDLAIGPRMTELLASSFLCQRVPPGLKSDI